MANIIQQAKQVHCILNGISLYGNVEEINVADLEMLTEEVRPNTDGVLDVETGLSKIDVELKVRGIHADVAAAFNSEAGNPNTRLEVLVALENYDAEVVQAKWNFVGLSKMYGTDPLQGKSELAMTTLTINCNFYEHILDGEEIFYIDILNNERRIRGVDRLEEIRAAIEV